MARIKIDTSRPLQLMAIDGPQVHVGSAGERVIGLAFQTMKFGTKETIPIELAMLPERAAVLLQLLQELRDRGMLPDVPGSVSQHWRQ